MSVALWILVLLVLASLGVNTFQMVTLFRKENAISTTFSQQILCGKLLRVVNGRVEK